MRARNLFIAFTALAVTTVPLLACCAFAFVAAAAAGVPPVNGYEETASSASGPTVAIIDIKGVILSDAIPGGEIGASSRDLVPLIQRVGKDDQVKAILLRIDSPGGGVVASDEIYHALVETKKPIVALMQETAASGGYYIAMSAKHVMANPNTTTGSIGVILTLANVEELLSKIGVRPVTIKSGELKDLGAFDRSLTEKERQVLQAFVDDLYGGFVRIVAESRGLSESRVRELADGRIYTGRQALALRLIDSLGYEAEARAKAAELGGISGTPRFVEYKRRPSGLTGLLEGSAASAARTALQIALREASLTPRPEFRAAP